jgi:hypothetical protein
MSVVPFKKPQPKKPRIRVCDCHNESFWVYEDGRIQCMQCDRFDDGIRGVWSFVVDQDEPA